MLGETEVLKKSHAHEDCMLRVQAMQQYYAAIFHLVMHNKSKKIRVGQQETTNVFFLPQYSWATDTTVLRFTGICCAFEGLKLNLEALLISTIQRRLVK